MQRDDPTDSNACFRYLLITVCRSEQQANRSISHGERSERHLAPSVCFASFVGLLSRVNVCLSACDSQRQAHSSDRCNNAMLIYDRVVELMLRSGCLPVCLRFGSIRRAFLSHLVDSSQSLHACDSVRALCLMPEIDLRRLQNRVQIVHERPEAAQSATRAFQVPPKSDQERPKSIPRAVKRAPIAPKSAPRPSQERPRARPDPLKSAPRRPGQPS